MKRFVPVVGLAASLLGACTSPTGPALSGRVEGKPAAQLIQALAQNTDDAPPKAEHLTAHLIREHAGQTTYHVTARTEGVPTHYTVTVYDAVSGVGKDLQVTPVAELPLVKPLPLDEANARARTQVDRIQSAYDAEKECKQDLEDCLLR